MDSEEYAVRVARAYTTLPAGNLRPVTVADAVLEELVGAGYSPEDYSELRDIIVGMASMFLSILVDPDTRDIVLDALDHTPKQEVIH